MRRGIQRGVQAAAKASAIGLAVLLGWGVTAGAADEAASPDAFAEVIDASHAIRVEPAPEWSALFSRSEGWTGADGIYSMPLDGRQVPSSAGPTGPTLFVFGDTIVGKVDSETGSRVRGWRKHHFSSAILDGPQPDPQKIRFSWPGSRPEVRGFRLAVEPLRGLRFWLQDGLVMDGHLYSFAMGVRPLSEQYPWWTRGTMHFKTPLADEGLVWKSTGQRLGLSDHVEDEDALVYFGAGILENTEAAGWAKPDGYIYVYGRYERAMRPFDPWNQRIELVVARVRPEDWEFDDRWRYWTGETWSASLSESAPLGLGGPELSVTPMECGVFAGKYLLISKHPATDLYYRVGETPYGPFGPPQRFYATRERETYGAGVETYNAKAHPHLSRPGRLLVSYNVNWADQLGQVADIYRPRFLWLEHAAEGECPGSLAEAR